MCSFPPTTTSSARPSAFACSATTSPVAGTTAVCIGCCARAWRCASTRAAPPGSVSPPRRTQAELAHLLGMGFDVAGLVAAHPDVAARAPGFRPPLLAIPSRCWRPRSPPSRSRCSPPVRSAIGSSSGSATGSSTTALSGTGFPSQADVRGGDLTGVGLSQAKIRTSRRCRRPISTWPTLPGPRDSGAAAGAARDRAVDGRLVPGPLPRPARRVRPRRPRRAQGGGPVVLGRSHLAAGAGTRGLRAVRTACEPRGSLPAPARGRLTGSGSAE